MLAAARMAAEEILEGVGDKEQVVRSGGRFAVHTRRRANAEETRDFIGLKAAGHYAHRLVAKGIV